MLKKHVLYGNRYNYNYSLWFKVMFFGQKLVRRILLVTRIRLQPYRTCTNIAREEDAIDTQYDNVASKFFSINDRINCLVIQPYLKWGPKKVLTTTPELQLNEAVSLVRSLNSWEATDKVTIPLLSFNKRCLFGLGTLERLQGIMHSNPKINAIFISISMLKFAQIEELERIFKVPVFDRYKVVVNILRLHAISNEARLQVSLAEIPYLRSQINHPIMMSAGKTEVARKNLLQIKENKVKKQLAKLKNQRQLIRKKRDEQDFITVSVIGYTNAGKTSLIKALTKDDNLKPKDYLFATLDVTTHMGSLPSRLPVLYTDTVGFMADIPTSLIECFLVTLEDAMIADVIIHIQNLAHPDFHHQNQHVENVLKTLSKKISESGQQMIEKPLIRVANKSDIKVIEDRDINPNVLCVSSKTFEGLNTLKMHIEDVVLRKTNRKKIKIRVRSGAEEMRWLHKNGTVVDVQADKKNSEYSVISVILTETKINQFRHYFINNPGDKIANT